LLNDLSESRNARGEHRVATSAPLLCDTPPPDEIAIQRPVNYPGHAWVVLRAQEAINEIVVNVGAEIGLQFFPHEFVSVTQLATDPLHFLKVPENRHQVFTSLANNSFFIVPTVHQETVTAQVAPNHVTPPLAQ
jgi:hypothetical protein